MLNFTPDQLPQIHALTEEQIHDMHSATLKILERTGVEVRHPRALELLREAGAKVEGERVRIPAELVEKAIQSAPAKVSVWSRTGENEMALEANKVYFGTGSDTPSTMDPRTGERRPPRFQDVVDIARLCDALTNYDFVMSMGIINDAPAQGNYLYGFAAMATGSSKPIICTANHADDMAAIYKMAVAIAGSEEALRAKPIFGHYAEPITPLIHSPTGVGKILFCAEHGIPVAYVSGMLAGGTAPVTLAGACALANAEGLSGLVIHQLAAPGAPFIFGTNTTVIDMTNSTCVYGSPEWRLTDALFADLSRHYELPVWATAGTTDSKVVDAQAGLEAMFSLNMSILSRGNLVHDLGYIDSGLTSSMEMILLCDEIIQMISVPLRGMPFDEARFALDEIDSVGPGGHFLDTDHTVRYFRTDHFLPRLIDRQNFDGWSKSGSKSLAQRANARVLEILDSHQPAPLPDEAKAVIEEVLANPSEEQQG
ncbi:MAG: trimethylamine methyltransferase [Armatimonadetes bacterium]|nr:trimethylamine methyltransferase [Armatimonadota bacterium]NIM24043.1 trimethylamine methyltransferase [Armatimonadota bacterium]NIM67897.1 trimethylamine methyltransferase [Armatimonadota bacterium]NIM76419.1 trimethylamine methyltransferase [Armatimonadota bacterium]NIN06127.1 trimethylamine methyltransferase [Armatimonadota bacterium]